MKKTIFFIIIFFIPLIFNGQSINSLKTSFLDDYTNQDTNIYAKAIKILDYYKYRFPDSALYFCKLAVEFSKRKNDRNKYQEFKIYEGDIYNISNNYYYALYSYNFALKSLSNNIESREYSRILYKISLSSINAGFSVDLPKKYLKQAIEISKNMGDKETEALCAGLLSVLYSKNSNFDSAFEYINKSITEIKNSNNNELISRIYYYYSYVYYDKHEYIKAATYIKKSISLSERNNNEGFYKSCLASLYLKMGFYDASKNIYNSVEEIFIKSNNNVWLTNLYLDLSDLSFLQEKNDEAIKYAQRALKLSKYLNIKKFQQDAYQKLSKIYNANQQVDLALFSFQKYSEIRDSLFSQKMNNDAKLLYNNYLMQLKLKDNQLLFRQKQYQELKNKQQRLAIYILTISGFLLLVIIAILAHLYNLKKSNEERLKQITEASLEGIIIHDGEKIIDLNDKFCEISGFSRTDVIGKSIYVILPEDSKNLVRKKFNLKRTTFYQMEMLRADGSLYEAEVLSKPIAYKNNNAKVVSIRDLSEIRKIQKKLHATKEQFKVMIETSPDGVLIADSNEKIKYVSPAFVQLFDYDKPEDFLGKKLSDFVIPLYKKKVKIDFKNIAKGEFLGVSEYIGIKKDGKEFYTECNGSNLKDSNGTANGVFMIVRDVTERKIVENALIQSESRFRGLFNNSKEAILVQDSDYRIIDANPSACKLLNFNYNELISMDFRHLLQDEYQNISYDKYIDENTSFEAYLYTKVRKKIFIQASISVFPHQSQSNYLLSIKDLTIFKRQEERLKRVANKLLETNATKDKMFSIISHDLRGPIGNLKSMIEYIAENPEDFDTNEIIDVIKSLRTSSTQTYELLENLLNWAKSQQNILEYNPDIFNLKEIIDSTVNFTQQIALSKNIMIEKKLEDNLYVVADENMIKTILRNLISNAIKFTHNNGKIFVHAKDDGDVILVSIKDTGVGISDDNLMKIFDQNTFITTYGTNHEKGSGLGLKLCYEFIMKNNGKIWVNSSLGNGTTFFFTIRKA